MKSEFVRCPNNRPTSRTALLAVHGSRVSDYTRDASRQKSNTKTTSGLSFGGVSTGYFG